MNHHRCGVRGFDQEKGDECPGCIIDQLTTTIHNLHEYINKLHKHDVKYLGSNY